MITHIDTTHKCDRQQDNRRTYTTDTARRHWPQHHVAKIEMILAKCKNIQHIPYHSAKGLCNTVTHTYDSGTASSFIPLFSALSRNICIASVVLVLLEVFWLRQELQVTGCWPTAKTTTTSLIVTVHPK